MFRSPRNKYQNPRFEGDPGDVGCCYGDYDVIRYDVIRCDIIYMRC